MTIIYENRKKQKNPEHISDIQLLWITNQLDKILLSPKADGTYSQIQIDKYYFEAEYIEKYNLYLVFDTTSYPLKHNDNIHARIKWIRGLHVLISKSNTCKYVIENEYELKEQIEIQNNMIDNYLTTTKDKIKWFPKYSFTVNMEKKNFLELLDIIPNTNYKTDGWIINIDKHVPLKYKPRDELTIDLLLKGNMFLTCENEHVNVSHLNNKLKEGIWRCYWGETGWIPRELRNDKVIPNPISLVNQLTKLHQNYWKASDMIKYLKYIYYSHEKQDLNKKTIEYLSRIKDYLMNNLDDVIKNHIMSNLNIFDIGCGKGNLIPIIKQITNQKFKYYGIDIDPSCIYVANMKYTDKSFYSWQWIDMTSDKLLENETGTFTMIIANNSLHNCRSDEQLIVLLDRINKVTTKGTVFYIHFIDADKIKNLKDDDLEIQLIDTNEQIYYFKYPWITNGFHEQILSYKNIKKIMSQMNWKLEKEFDSGTLNNSYDVFNSYHTSVLFIKE
ncbi:MAG: hypothetical protein Edafosvirus7_40 [Edafosvirus sp.]|uniref:Methyltransferase type 12 domain-containing protein n=1 Tax=Edafosvirus sp. TaxID=2487765 RepID=A0A3G4ZTM8_9VIRU|nr:MAG: hypothetical protein Edafosvirus7_40 [Edafosvirus sp.]